MNDIKIVVPLLDWLIGGSRIGGGYNIYTGSVGTDPYLGALGRQIANYRIWIEKDEEGAERISVAVYSGMESFANLAQDDDVLLKKSFELKEESRKEIETWLEDKIRKIIE